jgi:hypothetical protein
MFIQLRPLSDPAHIMFLFCAFFKLAAKLCIGDASA